MKVTNKKKVVDEEKLEKAIAQCQDPKNELRPYQVAKLHGVD